MFLTLAFAPSCIYRTEICLLKQTPSFKFYTGISDRPIGQTHHSVSDNSFQPPKCSCRIRTFSVTEYFLLKKDLQSSRWPNLFHTSLKCHKQSKNCPISALFLLHRKKFRKNNKGKRKKKTLGKYIHSDLCMPYFLKILAQFLLR